ncbi:MAG: hypothetical protein IPL52_00765 [Flavobacteriales bacterium]|nr:hypothetical protein [Flavobacteriales bacterium]
MDPLRKLDLADLDGLLAMEPERALGRILELNRNVRYHNTLNVIELLVRLREMREQMRAGARRHAQRRVA